MVRAIIALAVVGVCVLVAVVLWRTVASMRVGAAQDEKMTSLFVADPNNKTTLSIRGWHRAELDKILADFSAAYGLSAPSAFMIEAKSNDSFEVTFPGDIQPKLLFFLVNYLRYPKDFNLAHRSIGVLARVVLTPAFGAPDATLVGKQLMIYVPANDTEYDMVYAQVESGGTYKIPFTNLIWEGVDEARMPSEVAGL